MISKLKVKKGSFEVFDVEANFPNDSPKYPDNK